MNYYDKTLSALNEIKNGDENMLALFAFGSFVTKESVSKNYKEIRVFDGSQFVFSKFDLINIYPDIDIICVSKDIKKTANSFDEKILDVFGHYITINLLNKEVFEKELFSDHPNAIKRILLYRELLIMKGAEYINKLKVEVKKIETRTDSIFQQEFDFRKEYLKLFAKNHVPSMMITNEEYERLFPHFLKFITGHLLGGFPEDRIKLVYPEPMDMKASINLSDTKLEKLI
mgnify:CR=1 FL=1